MMVEHKGGWVILFLVFYLPRDVGHLQEREGERLEKCPLEYIDPTFLLQGDRVYFISYGEESLGQS